MFFTGDSSVRRRVDLGGRSSKERDRQNLLEQARVERKKRLGLRQSNSAALKIQKFFRGRKVVELARSKLRENFFYTFGERCQNVDRYCFHPDSDFLRQLLFVFDSHNIGDFYVLLKTCQLFHHFVQESGNIVSFLGGGDYSSTHTIVDIRVKRLAYACLQAVHGNRDHLKDQFYLSSGYDISPINTLLQTVATIIDPNLPWSCKVVGYLTQKHIFAMLRNIVLKGMKDANAHKHHKEISPVESVLILIASHIGGKTCSCPEVDPQWSFFSQILSIPFLWQHFPYLQEAFAQRQGGHYIHQMALHLHSDADFLPQDISPEFPGYACLLGNILEIAVNLFCQSICTFDLAKEFGAVSTFLLEALPLKSLSRGGEEIGDDEIDIEDNPTKGGLTKDLESQISNAISPRLLHDMVNVLFRETSLLNPSPGHVPSQGDVAAVGVICSLLNVIFNLLPLERFMTGLAYRTELIPMLWNFMKRCHENKKWPSLNEFSPFISGDAPGWLVPLAVFCPVYKHMLTIVDEEEFYDQKKPLSLTDIRKLIIILRETLWQLLWVIPAKFPATQKPFSYLSGCKRNSVESMQNTVAVLTSELLSQLQDWNNRKEFTSASDFHAHEAVDEIFISQSTIENSRAYEILKHAPFLVPFTSRVRIVTSQLASARQRSNAHAFTRNRFRIRRDRIFEDAFNQMRVLSDDDLRGLIRITFVNEFGVEEAGIDGGGIFKDFMENITRAGFDVQYGLFKETTDHLLYPNPGSGLVHEQHLHFFHFLGIILGKAMFEGILVDIPFATFFLSKLKQKHNYLNDLPSLDPELYRHLLFLKHYEGDISELELYFVIINNEYGEQIEEELLPGGTNLRVTNENVITYIHLIANHRLNFQIRQQSTHFLRGFQLLIQKEWIAMFNEHELQILISGSLEGMDVNDLRSNAHYSGGYHDEHFVIVMFWDVIKNFSLDKQKKFLKFVTGCSRGPLLGFKYLEPQFCIQLAGAADPEVLDRLPTSATCMNLLKLPPYRSKEQLEMKLIYAINADAGFDLS